ncbi:uncharacterized protein LOC120339366 isoform X2 [Styela clava]|uniref:uncharacterized protein LOC120339366 isoform X2 n=1 Tax=Styela clava TaxID=7725 RepID=UPI00193A900E|nr:uncharacterized protein LOC120339366 isoform X2 [Styela clava]
MNTSAYTNVIFAFVFLRLATFSKANTILESIILIDDEIYDIRDLSAPAPLANTVTAGTSGPSSEAATMASKTTNVTSTPTEITPSENMTVAGVQNGTEATVASFYLPERCSLPVDKGFGRANIFRYFYNKTSEQCELFVYAGSDGNENRFFTKDHCMNECFIPKNKSSIRSDTFDCTFDAMILDRCRLTSDFQQMTGCARVSLFGSNRKQCSDAGCCWHHSFRICYQTVARNVRTETCQIFLRQGSIMYGIANFQSPAHYRRGWMAYLTFTERLPGPFCILKNDFEVPITIGNRFIDDRGIILQGSNNLRAGERTEILFAGSLNRERLNPTLCRGQQSFSSNRES